VRATPAQLPAAPACLPCPACFTGGVHVEVKFTYNQIWGSSLPTQTLVGGMGQLPLK